jgi:hypothetical protein
MFDFKEWKLENNRNERDHNTALARMGLTEVQLDGNIRSSAMITMADVNGTFRNRLVPSAVFVGF